MKRLIYSMYVNIPSEDIEKQHADCDWTKNNTHTTTNKLLDNKDWLTDKQSNYAKLCGADYRLFDYNGFVEFRDLFFQDRPYISTYDVINFYKIWLLSTLDEYDEILYLDLDVIPWTKENIFEAFDFDDGIICRVNHEGKFSLNTNISYNPTIRAPKAKWWNARALLLDEGFTGENDVYNTGIVGGSRAQIKKLNYFEEFDKALDIMHEMTLEDCGYPPPIRRMFGYDNETLFNYKMQMNEVKLLEMDNTWHFIMNKNKNFIISDAKMVHVISKEFEFAKDRYEKTGL